MGEVNDVLLGYLEDNARFADLFNGVMFGGKQVVEASRLQEGSERYTTKTAGKGGNAGHSSRVRDVKKRLVDGTLFRVLGLEAQGAVDYSMPLRCMNYDVQEYMKQLKQLQRKNDQEGSYASGAERLCRLHRTDRLFPVYTICLYHGIEEWDGPIRLSDMMAFGEPDAFRHYFKDYSFELVRADRPMNYSGFRTSLKELLAVLPYRKDQKGFEKLLMENPAYRRLDGETMEAIAVMTRNKELLQRSEEYKKEEGYDMCEAMQGMLNDSLNKGKEAGRMEKLIQLVCIKMNKEKPLDQIAEELEEERAVIAGICQAAKECGPGADSECIYARLKGTEVG